MDLLCRLLKISRSGYYAWKNRSISSQKQREQLLLSKLVELHEKYPASGLNSLHHIITNGGISCSRNRLHRLMKKYNIHSVRKRAYTVTTNSKHNCPVSPNLLKRDFTASKPGTKWVVIFSGYFCITQPFLSVVSYFHPYFSSHFYTPYLFWIV